LFEDRILKASWMRIGRRCEVGAGSVVLYDTEMEDGSRLDALSLLMKGEVLPTGTSWVGSPAKWVVAAHPSPPAPAQQSRSRVEPEYKQATSFGSMIR